VALVGALVALVWLPSRAAAPAEEVEDEVQEVESEPVLDAALVRVD
jgi:hypothetical protein